MFIEIITHITILGICANSLLIGTHKNAFYFVSLLLYIIIIIKYKIELTQIINLSFTVKKNDIFFFLYVLGNLVST